MRFHEEQRIGGVGFKVLTAGLLLPIPVVLIALLLAVPDLGETPWPLLIPLGNVFALDVGIWLVLWRSRLIVAVEDDRVVVAWRPLTTRTIPAEHVERVTWMTSGLRRRFGAGIGKRWGAKRARYTVGNDAGVILTLTDGWTVVIGSDRTEELGGAIRDLVLKHRPELRWRNEEQHRLEWSSADVPFDPLQTSIDDQTARDRSKRTGNPRASSLRRAGQMAAAARLAPCRRWSEHGDGRQKRACESGSDGTGLGPALAAGRLGL